MIFLLIILIFPVQNYEEMIYYYNAATNGIEGWKTFTKSTIFELNSDIILYGGSSPRISRMFLDLSPHYQVKVKMEFWLKDLITTGGITVYIDEIQVYKNAYSNTSLSSLHGPTPTGSYFDSIVLLHPQKKRTSSIYIEITGQSLYGIRTLQFYLERCPSGCEVCDSFDFLACKQWKLFNLSFNKYYFSNLQGWSTESPWLFQGVYVCAQCDFLKQSGIQYFGVLPPHQGLMLKFFWLFNIGFLNIKINRVNYVLQQPTTFYQVELIIKDHTNQDLLIEIQQGFIRDVELYYQPDVIHFDPEILNCFSVINNVCISCLDGWEFEEIQNQCHPLCGLEECDDGNEDQNDGCYQCKLKCDINCISCEFGKCNNCDTGYILSDNQNNFPQCYQEIVEYPDNCLILEEQQCKECEVGYIQENGQCFPHCGDGIQISGLEECDDGNLVPYDGCFNCSFQCSQNCIICIEGICYQYCEEGFEFIDQSCQSICGDGLITNLEECEDGNIIPYDGCYLCKFSCPLNCLECLNGYCLQCNTNYQLLSNNQCDYIQLQYQQKQCDDQNNDAYDGCHNFMIQHDWICRRLNQETFSQCSYFNYPKLLIQYQKLIWNIQYVTLTFSQPFKIGENRLLLEAFTYSILNLTEPQYIIKVIGSQESSKTINKIDYQLEIEIFQLLEFKPILKINLQQEIIKQWDFMPILKTYYQPLQLPTYLNEKQTYYSEMAQKVNRYSLFSYGGVCTLLIFQGKYEVLIEILNFLQFQNYLRYINVQFPQNLLLYFESYDLLSIETLFDFVKFKPLESFLFYKEFREASGKFQFYQQNADLLTNLQWQIIQSSFYILLILLSIGTKKFIFSNYFRQRALIYLIQQKINSDKEISSKLLLWLYKKCQQLIGVVDLFSKNGFKIILLVNGWDLIFKGMLYLKYLQNFAYRDIFSLLLALVLIFIYIMFILNSNNLYPKYNLIKFQKMKQNRFEVLNLGVSLCFIGFLIFLENSEVLQLGLISLINLMQLKLIYNYRKIIRSFVVQMAIQSSVLIFTLSSFIYVQEAAKYVNEDFKIKCGWFHIFLLSFGVLIEISEIIIEQIQQYFRMCKKKQNQTQQDQFMINF
ncbi:unnamed protein product [Paramecium octaurelia]|uniref:Insulin-like growth factor binding protein, N-terminal n=1 Tax=Paramecium octaurelia TaxID=43137 RepID=A0A8S1XHZ0_PAROT|nr:unnamed protein product [Paramecium octaurelia]